MATRIEQTIKRGQSLARQFAVQGDWKSLERQVRQTAVDVLKLEEAKHRRLLDKVNRRLKRIDAKVSRLRSRNRELATRYRQARYILEELQEKEEAGGGQ